MEWNGIAVGPRIAILLNSIPTMFWLMFFNSEPRKYLSSADNSLPLRILSIITTDPEMSTTVTNCLVSLMKLIPVIKVRVYLWVICVNPQIILSFLTIITL